MSASAVRLLIIDDDEAILSLLNDTLSPLYQTVTVQDWLEGIDLLMKDRFDLLIIDLAMPVFDAVEFINKIRSYPMHDRMPVVVISAYANLRERLDGASVQAVIAKPFSLVYLTDTIASVLQNAGR